MELERNHHYPLWSLVSCRQERPLLSSGLQRPRWGKNLKADTLDTCKPQLLPQTQTPNPKPYNIIIAIKITVTVIIIHNNSNSDNTSNNNSSPKLNIPKRVNSRSFALPSGVLPAVASTPSCPVQVPYGRGGPGSAPSGPLP